MALVATTPSPFPFTTVIRYGLFTVVPTREDPVHFQGAGASSKTPIPSRFAAVLGETTRLSPWPLRNSWDVNKQYIFSLALDVEADKVMHFGGEDQGGRTDCVLLEELRSGKIPRRPGTGQAPPRVAAWRWRNVRFGHCKAFTAVTRKRTSDVHVKRAGVLERSIMAKRCLCRGWMLSWESYLERFMPPTKWPRIMLETTLHWPMEQ